MPARIRAARKPAADRFAIKSQLLDPEVQFKKGAALVQAGQHREALQQLQFAHDCDPQNSNYRAELAFCRFQVAPRSEAERALEQLTETLRIDPKCGLAVYYTGMVYGRTGRLKQAEVSVLYADIVGFTAYSEKAQPGAVAELLAGYFTHAAEAIFSHGGTLDKFIGDCVMAFFGAPMRQADHAVRAVQTAIDFYAALDGWNAERRRQGLPHIASRIGINSGPVVVGDIGSKKRVDYTVLGNTVNLAARLEEKVAGPGEIVVGEETQRLLAGTIATESLGDFQLKGLSVPIAARTARTAWSAWRTGAPKKAITQSPMYLSRVPPHEKIASTAWVKYPSIRSATSSGRAFSE